VLSIYYYILVSNAIRWLFHDRGTCHDDDEPWTWCLNMKKQGVVLLNFVRSLVR